VYYLIGVWRQVMDNTQIIHTLSIIADAIIISYFAVHVFKFTKKCYNKLQGWLKSFAEAIRQASRG
jgi:hypothetical protein